MSRSSVGVSTPAYSGGGTATSSGGRFSSAPLSTFARAHRRDRGLHRHRRPRLPRLPGRTARTAVMFALPARLRLSHLWNAPLPQHRDEPRAIRRRCSSAPSLPWARSTERTAPTGTRVPGVWYRSPSQRLRHDEPPLCVRARSGPRAGDRKPGFASAWTTPGSGRAPMALLDAGVVEITPPSPRAQLPRVIRPRPRTGCSRDPAAYTRVVSHQRERAHRPTEGWSCFPSSRPW